jgi:hypothetical protein
MSSKMCSKCKIVKPVDRFSFKSPSKVLLRSHCKECSNLSGKKYALKYKNNGRAKEIRDAYRKKNGDKLREQERLRYLKNPKKARLRHQNWKLKNPGRLKECDIKYRKNNHDKILHRNALYRAKKANNALKIIKVESPILLRLHRFTEKPRKLNG